MDTQEIIQKLKEGEICTLTTLTQTLLLDMGYSFIEEGVEHKGFYISWSAQDGFSLNATANSNDPYVLFKGTNSLGGDDGLLELIKVGGPSFDRHWRGINGNFVDLS